MACPITPPWPALARRSTPSRPSSRECLKSRRSSPTFADRSERSVTAGRGPVVTGAFACSPDHDAARNQPPACNRIKDPHVLKFPMTAPGLQRLEEELRHLKSEERPSIIRQ